jgi:drug/metabolite transporter (DMT)-like permease
VTIGVLLAVLGAAFLHALWNSMVKVGASRLGAMVALTIWGAVIGFLVAGFRPLPAPAVLPWLATSAVAHFFYMFCLASAYERGDLSRVYPIARGTAPLLVALTSGLVTADLMTAQQYAGVFVLGLGILLMAQGVFASNENRRLIPFALGSALATACYTLSDGQGARVAGDAVAYVAWTMILNGLTFAPIMLAWKGAAILPRQRRVWTVGGLAALASYVAYAVSVWAMTVAPIALVAALRETSILFAVMIGWLAFGERMTRGKLVASAVIVGGVMLTRL